MTANTVNIGLLVPATGADVGTWGAVDINPDMVAIDGLIGGVAVVGLAGGVVTLTAPAGVITASAGPNQAQNAVLRFTGVLASNSTVILPLPGYYIIDNQTTGNFAVLLRAAAAGLFIGVEQGVIQHVYNDGQNVYYANLGRPGRIEHWAGLSAMPTWVTLSSFQPYLLCDGGLHSVGNFPYLARQFGSTFGGDGVTTFGCPDLRGRSPFGYNAGTGRITTAGSGINGDVIGSAGGAENHILTAAESAVLTYTAGVTPNPHSHSYQPANPTDIVNTIQSGSGRNAGGQYPGPGNTGTQSLGVTVTANGGGGAHAQMPPAQVSGIWVVKT